MNTKKKWNSPSWTSLEIDTTTSGTGSGVAGEGIHGPSTLAVLGS